MAPPLEVHLEAETYGLGDYLSMDRPLSKGSVVLGGLDVTAYVKEVTLRSGAEDITALELTLINIRVNRKEAT